MVLEQRHDALLHGAPSVPCKGGDACGCGLGCWAGGRRWGRTGQVEEALVLPVRFLQHGGELRDMLTVGLLPLGIQASLLPFPVLHEPELFTEDVYEGVCRRL